jgi:hypothetical protein
MITYGIALGAVLLGGWLIGTFVGYGQGLDDAKEAQARLERRGTIVGPPRSLE